MYHAIQSTDVKESYYEEVIQREIFCGLKGIIWGTALSLPLWGLIVVFLMWLF